MLERLLGLFAFAILTVFVGILAWKVATIDLFVVVAVTLLLAGYDLLTTHGSSARRN